ncbi:hypothetical protein CROQUDRAFT_668861 [Cronartium quercuum f. sp. fusiforme G11]|uniref:COP9 signalosome complex subunit 4 n=1 Tax=Cronartium quercuum f. sp. fusiforme G11 TaxID=708437 RepID=A0A9P6NPS5_9BASI|nr:hypothetical protein CROQUDRAFT_668861 [Cronartium quercuum f. sp. fusiforme G11]
MDSRLLEISQLGQTAKTPAYVQLLDSLFANPNSLDTISSLSQFVGAVVQDAVGLLVTRTVLSELIERIKTNIPSTEIRRKAIETVLDQSEFRSRESRFEAHVAELREMLAGLLEDEEDWSSAARMLQGIPMNPGHRTISDEYRLRIYIRIVRLFIEDDDATSAETYLNRASLLIPSTKDEATILTFKLSQARIFDARRRFEEASKKYHEISFTPSLAEDEREQCLSAALVCAVLAPAGPSRSRLLASLFRDERTSSLPHHTILSKMFLGQIIRSAELVEFERGLRPHQLAQLPASGSVHQEEDDDKKDDPMRDGPVRQVKQGPQTVFDRAMMQHNLLATSKIYDHVTLKGLGIIVGLTAGAVEVMARTMIQEGRLKASIDQVDRMVTFQRERKVDGDVVVSNVAAAGGAKAEGEGGDEMLGIVPVTIRWDEAIRETSHKVESIYEHVSEILSAKEATPIAV